MFTYVFELTPSKPRSEIDYCSIRQILLDTVESVNHGYSFQLDGKSVTVSNIEPQKISLTLQCKTALRHAARSLSAITRYLTGHYAEIFQAEIYNKTLFHMNLISQKSSFDCNTDDISDTDLLKGVVDLLYTYTTTTRQEAQLRVETIHKMKDLIKPYLHLSKDV